MAFELLFKNGSREYSFAGTNITRVPPDGPGQASQPGLAGQGDDRPAWSAGAPVVHEAAPADLGFGLVEQVVGRPAVEERGVDRHRTAAPRPWAIVRTR